MKPPPPVNPSWDNLFNLAASQDGYFTTKQAHENGYSSQLLNHHLKANRLSRPFRGVYRIVHFPDSDHVLVPFWLWSDQLGVFSHETALALHELSDLMPTRQHISLPTASSGRRRITPDDLVVHYADVPVNERSWVANVPATTPKRTLVDCAMSGLQPEFLRQATQQAVARGLIATGDIVEVERALRPFGGLHP